MIHDDSKHQEQTNPAVSQSDVQSLLPSESSPSRVRQKEVYTYPLEIESIPPELICTTTFTYDCDGKLISVKSA